MLQMLLEATHVGGKAVQAQAGGARQYVQKMDNTVLLRQELRIAYGLVAQLHLKNINRHNDSLIHTRFSLFINAELIQP